MSLHAKMAEATKNLGGIEKKGHNSFFNYDYVREEDVITAVRKALSEKGVAVYVGSRITETRPWKTPKGKDTLITHVEATLTFADGETGETFEITAAGTGDDSSDKGTYKALTGAVKYALMKTFLISTGDDPEQGQEATPDEALDVIDPNTLRNLRGAYLGLESLVGKKEANEFVAQMLNGIGLTKFTELSQAQGEACLATLELHRVQVAESVPA